MSDRKPEQNSCAQLHNDEKYKEALVLYEDLKLDGVDPFQYMISTRSLHSLNPCLIYSMPFLHLILRAEFLKNHFQILLFQRNLLDD